MIKSADCQSQMERQLWTKRLMTYSRLLQWDRDLYWLSFSSTTFLAIRFNPKNKNSRLASHLDYYDLKTEHVAIQF